MSLQSRLAALISAIGTDIKTLQESTVRSYSETLSTSATVYVVTHNLGTRDVIVQVVDADGGYFQVWTTIERTTINTVTLRFATAPAEDQCRVIIQGKAD